MARLKNDPSEDHPESFWMPQETLTALYSISRDVADRLRESGTWPRGVVWQKLGEGRASRVLFRRLAIDSYMAYAHDEQAWKKALADIAKWEFCYSD